MLAHRRAGSGSGVPHDRAAVDPPARAGPSEYVALLLLYVSIALGVSFLCSLLEATLLASRNVTLAEQQAAGNRGAALLLTLKQNRVDDAISAILILNTVANTLGATLAGAQAARVFGSAWVGLFSGVLTFMILLVSEIIPKTLGAVYARQLSGTVGWVLSVLMRLLSPVLVLSGSLTGLLMRGRTSHTSRSEVTAIIAAASREGTLSPEEFTMHANLLRLNEVQVEDVMTPRTVLAMMPAETTVGEMLSDREAEAFSRIPLYRGKRDDIVGYVLQRDVLREIAQGGDRNRALSSFMREISFIPELATVGDALRQLLERSEAIAIATDEHGGVSGLVSLEDLTETILGVEIVDESDRVADMRQSAARLRDQRLKRMQQRRRASRD